MVNQNAVWSNTLWIEIFDNLIPILWVDKCVYFRTSICDSIFACLSWKSINNIFLSVSSRRNTLSICTLFTVRRHNLSKLYGNFVVFNKLFNEVIKHRRKKLWFIRSTCFILQQQYKPLTPLCKQRKNERMVFSVNLIAD